MDLRSVIAFLRRAAPYMVVGLIVGSVAAYFASGMLPRVYRASATMLIGQQLTAINPAFSELQVSLQLSRSYAELAETRPVYAAVVAKLGLDIDPDELGHKIRTAQPGDGTLVDIIAEDESPETAAAIANAVADEIVRLSPTLRGENAEITAFVRDALEATQAQIETGQAELDELLALPEPEDAQVARISVLQDRLTSLRSTYASLLTSSTSAGANLVTVFDRATVPDGPVNPGLVASLLPGALVGLLLAMLIVGVRDSLDDSVKTSDEVEELLSLPTLGRIENFPGGNRTEPLYSLVTILHPRSPSAEAFRTLRTNLDFAGVDQQVATILVTSALPREGKTTVAANLAVAYAQSGRSTILVDSDLRRPDIHTLFRLSNAAGLTRALASRASTIAPFLQETEVTNLRVLTAGPPPPNPAELIGSQRTKLLLDQLTEMADVVVLDSPPLTLVTDGAMLAAMADGAVLVVRAGQSRRAPLRAAAQALTRSGARILGAALNGVPKADADASGYHSYYYDRAPTTTAGGTVPSLPRVAHAVEVRQTKETSPDGPRSPASPPRKARTSGTAASEARGSNQ